MQHPAQQSVPLNHKTLGSGEALIILHGLFGSLDNWLLHAKALSESYSVFLIDQRNHGRSPHTARHDYMGMAHDLHDFMDSQGIWKAHLLGHSMGGKTVMQFAAEWPDRVEKLIVADMGQKAYPPHHDAILSALNGLELSSLTTREEAEQRLQAAGVENIGERQFLLKGLVRDENKAFSWRFNLPVLTHDYARILEGVALPYPLEAPALFLTGGNSHYLPEADQPPVKKDFPQAVFRSIAGAGHWLHADKPQEFLGEVKKFLSL